MTGATRQTDIHILLPDRPGRVVRFTLSDLGAVSGEVFPESSRYESVLDSSGEATISLPTPDNTGESSWSWDVRLPDDSTPYNINVPYDADEQELSALLAEHALSQPAAASLLAGKADVVDGASAGNLAGLDVDGNLTDSGIAAADVVAVDDPTESQIGWSPAWTGEEWSIGKSTVQDYVIGTLTDVGLVLAPNYEHEIPFEMQRQYSDLADLHGGGVGSTVTIRQDGLYNVAATIYQSGEAVDGVVIDLRLRKNNEPDAAGTLVGWERRVGNAAITTIPITVAVLGAYLTTGETIHLTLRHDHSGPLTFYVLRFFLRRAGQIS